MKKIISVGASLALAGLALASAAPAAAVQPFYAPARLPAAPPVDCVIDELRPNPDNPHTFYVCTRFGPVLMQCPSDLVFDVEANRCEWAKEPGDPGL